MVLVLIGMLLFVNLAFAEKEEKGYDEFGYNYNARIFNGSMEQYWSARDSATPEYDLGITLIMKWSKNFVIQDYNENSWITNHYTWYTDDYNDIDTYYGYEDVNGGVGEYRVEEFIKMKSFGDNPPVNIDELNLIWGNFVITMDIIKVYNVETGELVDEFEVSAKAHPGLGNLKF